MYFLFQCVDIDDGYLSLMDDSGETRDDLKLPDGDIGKEIQEKVDAGETFLVTVLKAMDDEQAIATKNINK